MDFRLDQAQLVVFLSAIDTSEKLRIPSSAVEAVGELRGVDPLMLPLPDSAPPEIPRIQLHNEEAGWAFQYSPIRIDLIRTPRVEFSPGSLPEVLADLQHRASICWDLLSSRVFAKGKRLAQVINVTAAVGSAAGLIQARFLSSQVREPVAEAQVHMLRKVDIAGLPSNRWVRILSQEATAERLFVHIDFNTVAERVLEVNPKMITHFGEAAAIGAADVLRDTIGDVA